MLNPILVLLQPLLSSRLVQIKQKGVTNTDTDMLKNKQTKYNCHDSNNHNSVISLFGT